MSKNIWLKKLLLGIAGGIQKKSLDKNSKNCQVSAEKVLRDILTYAKDTEYGKTHRFGSIQTPAEYASLVPIVDYEVLRPYITRHTKGEENILFPGKPLFYATTSGTVKEPKWIPITKKYYKECYQALSKLWLNTCIQQNPNIFDGHDLSIVGKAVEGYTEDGTPYGSMSGQVYTQIPGFMKDMHVVPTSIFEIADYETKYYCICRVTAEHNITYGITGNPSTYIQIIRKLKDSAHDIIKDVRNGTLKEDLPLENHIRNDIMALIKPNQKRADELEKIFKSHNNLDPKYIWPNLDLINTWKCGNSSLYLKHLDNKFPPQTIIREFAYMASECRAGVVINNHNLDSVLTCHLSYFEFIKEEEMESENPTVYPAWELEKGKRYNMIVTTSSGLYRYDMNDIIEVTGFYNEFPKIIFIQKGAGVVSMTGEKLNEKQLIESVKDIQKENNISFDFFISFAHIPESKYLLFCELEKDDVQLDLPALSGKIDKKLKEYNQEYAAKRDSLRLNELEVKLLVKDSFELFKQKALEQGGRDGQFKLVHLLYDDFKKKMFLDLVKK